MFSMYFIWKIRSKKNSRLTALIIPGNKEGPFYFIFPKKHYDSFVSAFILLQSSIHVNSDLGKFVNDSKSYHDVISCFVNFLLALDFARFS